MNFETMITLLGAIVRQAMEDVYQGYPEHPRSEESAYDFLEEANLWGVYRRYVKWAEESESTTLS